MSDACAECGLVRPLVPNPKLGFVCGLCNLSQKTEDCRPTTRSSMLPLRYRGQREGDVMREKPTCAKCGNARADDLSRRGGTHECTNKSRCDADVRSAARLSATSA